MRDDPTGVVSYGIFQYNQFPYLEVRRPFILGLAERKWQATLSHWYMVNNGTSPYRFVQICHDKGLLRRLFTQNIDGLDYQTNIPHDLIIGVN